MSRRHGLDSHQAVAVVIALIEQCPSVDGGDSTSTETPLTAEHVQLSADATVTCDRIGARTVPDVGRFLSSLLPQQGPVPGALRYAIARAQQDVDAPPFGSLEEFAAALERFEKGNRQEVLRGLYSEVVVLPGLPQASAAQVAVPQAVASPVMTSPTPVQSPAASVPPPSLADRRRRMPSATELRRQLREADRQLFEARLMLKRELPPASTRRR